MEEKQAKVAIPSWFRSLVSRGRATGRIMEIYGRNPFLVQVFGFAKATESKGEARASRNPFLVQVFGFLELNH